MSLRNLINLAQFFTMNKQNLSSPFLPETESDRLSIEIPAEPPRHPYDRIPSGYDPMGEVALRGRAFRRLSSGFAPWWVLMAGWAAFGGFAFMLLRLPLSTASNAALLALLPLILSLIPLLILVRGTIAKLTLPKRRRR